MDTKLKLAEPDPVEVIEPVLPNMTFSVEPLNSNRVRLAFNRSVAEVHLHPADAVAIGAMLLTSVGALRGGTPDGPRVIFWDQPQTPAAPPPAPNPADSVPDQGVPS